MDKEKQLKMDRVKEEMSNSITLSNMGTWIYSSLLTRIMGSKDVRKTLWGIKNETFKSSLGQYISQIIIAKGLTNKDVIQKAGFSKDYYYHVLSGRKKPSRDKILQLCFGLELGVEESNTLLKKAGHNGGEV